MTPLAAVLATARALPEADRAVVAAELTTLPWQAAQRRKEARAEAIQVAMSAANGRTPYGRACSVERCLKLRAQGRRGASPVLNAACDQVLKLNDGKPLGWRSVLRAEEFVKENAGDDKLAWGIKSE